MYINLCFVYSVGLHNMAIFKFYSVDVGFRKICCNNNFLD